MRRNYLSGVLVSAAMLLTCGTCGVQAQTVAETKPNEQTDSGYGLVKATTMEIEAMRDQKLLYYWSNIKNNTEERVVKDENDNKIIAAITYDVVRHSNEIVNFITKKLFGENDNENGLLKANNYREYVGESLDLFLEKNKYKIIGTMPLNTYFVNDNKYQKIRKGSNGTITFTAECRNKLTVKEVRLIAYNCYAIKKIGNEEAVTLSEDLMTYDTKENTILGITDVFTPEAIAKLNIYGGSDGTSIMVDTENGNVFFLIGSEEQAEITSIPILSNKILFTQTFMEIFDRDLKTIEPIIEPIKDTFYAKQDTEVDTPVRFPGGKEAFDKWKDNSAAYQKFANSSYGRKAHTCFVVNKNGNITGNILITILNDKPHTYINKQILSSYIQEAVKDMPQWEPATKDGQPVSMIVALDLGGDSVTATAQSDRPLPDIAIVKDMVSGQTKIENAELDSIQMPSFPGGDTAFFSWLSKNIKYPAIAEENGVQGRVLTRFILEKDGSVINVDIVESADPSLDREVARVILSMPRWIPAKVKGKPVPVYFTLPVTFQLGDTPKKSKKKAGKVRTTHRITQPWVSPKAFGKSLGR